MHNLVKYVSDVLNIKTDSLYTIQDITEELYKIKDIVAYRSYIKDNIKNIDVGYTSGFQKFIILTRKYLDLEYEASLGIEANRTAKTLSDKVAVCRTYIEDTNGAFSKVKKTDGAYLFTKDDINILRATGSALYLIEASKCNTLENELRKRIKILKQSKPYEQLSNRLKEMTSKMIKAK